MPARELIAAWMLAPFIGASIHAQPAAAVSYVYLRGDNDTLGVETITQRATSVDGLLTMKGQGRVEWSQAHQHGVPGALTVRRFAVGAAASALPRQSHTYEVIGDSAYVDLGTTRRRAIVSQTGARPLVIESAVQAAVLVSYARTRQLATIDVFLTESARTLPATVAEVRGGFMLMVGNLESSVQWSPDGLPKFVALTSQNARVVRAAATTSLASDARAPLRARYDPPSAAPYSARHIRIPTGRGYELAATLTRPDGVAKPAVVVTISGSGPQDRDGQGALVRGYGAFREIADTLARRGIAVLRWDDRGVGESGGVESAATGTSVDVADDVRSIVRWLRTRDDVDGARIALAGHSEGGLIAPMVAATDSTLRGIALLAGPAYNGRRILLLQRRLGIEALRLPKHQTDSLLALVPSQLDSYTRRGPWANYFMAYDPIPAARKLRMPVLVLQGLTDTQVTAEQADSLVLAIRSNGNTNVTLRTFPATNHLFVNDSVGAVSGYTTLKNTKVRRDVLGALADWAARVLK